MTLKKAFIKLIQIYKFIGVGLVVTAFLLLFMNISPSTMYLFDRGAVEHNSETITSTIVKINASEFDNKQVRLKSENESSKVSYSSASSLPKFDSSLTSENFLEIPHIGISAIIHGGTNGDEALDKGVWHQSTNINPSSKEAIVLASHRWGPLSWTNEFRNLNSFNALPSLKPGQEIFITHEQRKYKYVVTSVGETNSSINASVDLILYTCKYLRSDARIYVTAKLVNI